MSVREFDGVDDLLTLAGTGTEIANGAFTLIGIIKPLALGVGGSSQMVLGNVVSNTFLCTIGEAGSARVACFTNVDESFSGFGPFYSIGDWQIVAVTRAAAAEPTRQHASTVGSGTWVHDEGSGVIPLNTTICDGIAIAAYFTGVQFEHARYKAFAIYDRELTDAQVETLATPTAQKLADLGARQLVLLNQAATTDPVLDLVGNSNQVALVGSTVVTGDEPSGWSDAYTISTEFRLAGGAANTDPLLSLGGAKSSAVPPAGLFDQVPRDDALSGAVEYRLVYVQNNNVGATNAHAWITDQPGSTTLAIGAATESAGSAVGSTGNTATAPSGVTFSSPTTEGAAVALGSIPSGSYKGLWIRRTVAAATAGTPHNPWEVQVSATDSSRPGYLRGDFDIELPIGAPNSYVKTPSGLVLSTIRTKVDGALFPPL